jgi:hypothetical protein
MMEHKCKACGDTLSPDAEWRKSAPKKDGISPDDYCRTCYMELATGAIPNVVGSFVKHGSGGLTFRQAVKKN